MQDWGESLFLAGSYRTQPRRLRSTAGGGGATRPFKVHANQYPCAPNLRQSGMAWDGSPSSLRQSGITGEGVGWNRRGRRTSLGIGKANLTADQRRWTRIRRSFTAGGGGATRPSK